MTEGVEEERKRKEERKERKEREERKEKRGKKGKRGEEEKPKDRRPQIFNGRKWKRGSESGCGYECVCE